MTGLIYHGSIYAPDRDKIGHSSQWLELLPVCTSLLVREVRELDSLNDPLIFVILEWKGRKEKCAQMAQNLYCCHCFRRGWTKAREIKLKEANLDAETIARVAFTRSSLHLQISEHFKGKKGKYPHPCGESRMKWLVQDHTAGHQQSQEQKQGLRSPNPH